MTKTRARLIWLGALAVIAYLAYGIRQAGLEDVHPPYRGTMPLVFEHGSIDGERVNMHGWFVRYDRLVSSPDQRTLEMTGVHDGKVYVHGVAALTLRADHAVLDTVAHDFHAEGHVRIESLDPALKVVLDTDRATWSSTTKILTLPDPIVMHRDGIRTTIGRADLDVGRGELHLRSAPAAGPL